MTGKEQQNQVIAMQIRMSKGAEAVSIAEFMDGDVLNCWSEPNAN